MILSRTHSLLWAVLLFLLAAIIAPAAFGQDMTRFELEEREQPVEDTTEVDWMNDTTGTDTIEYRAVDLIYDVEKETFNLNNNAQLKYRTATLDADTIWFDQKNSVLAAAGEPVLRETKNPSLSGMRLKYNMNSRIGEIYYATTYQDNQQLNGMEVRRLPDSRIRESAHFHSVQLLIVLVGCRVVDFANTALHLVLEPHARKGWILRFAEDRLTSRRKNRIFLVKPNGIRIKSRRTVLELCVVVQVKCLLIHIVDKVYRAILDSIRTRRVVHPVNFSRVFHRLFALFQFKARHILCEGYRSKGRYCKQQNGP